MSDKIEALVSKVDEIQKGMGVYATDAKVEALAKAFAEFQSLKNAQFRKERAHKLMGTQENYDAVANAVGKALVAANKVEQKDLGKWLTKANANINSTDATQGPEFLPVTIDEVVGKLIEDNGVLRKYARVRPGVKGTLALKNRATRVTVNGVSRPDGALPTGGSTYGSDDLTTKEVGLITTVEEKLIWDSPVDMVQEAISDIAEAAAEFEDDVLFAGDGTAAMLGFTGLNGANTGIGGADESVAAGSFAVDNVLNVRKLVHTSVFGNGDYFMHPYVFATLQTKKASTAGSYFFDIQSSSFKLGGSNIVFAPRMDSSIAATKVPVIYGSLAKAVTVGLGREYQVRILNERYADEGQVGVRVVYDMGLVLRHPTAVAKVVLS